MTSLNYDANKLPLGKLSQNTLKKGNLVLKEISEVLADPKMTLSKYKASQPDVLARLTSRYYTIIPHVFGRNVPPIIDTVARLKREAELIESLGDMEIATEIMAKVLSCTDMHSIEKVANIGKVNVMDCHFESLQLAECHSCMF